MVELEPFTVTCPPVHITDSENVKLAIGLGPLEVSTSNHKLVMIIGFMSVTGCHVPVIFVNPP